MDFRVEVEMKTGSLVVEKVLGSLSEVHRKHANCRYAVLNDIAVIFYGLVKPIEEIRIILKNDCIDELLHTLLEVFNVEEHYVEAVEKLKNQGIIAISTIFYPPLIVELARSHIDEQLLENAVDVELENYVLRIPKIQYLIVKLISMDMYPYTEYAYALLVPWLKYLNVDELVSLLTKSGINIEKVVNKLGTLSRLITSFPELTHEIKPLLNLAIELRREICKVRHS